MFRRTCLLACLACLLTASTAFAKDRPTAHASACYCGPFAHAFVSGGKTGRAMRSKYSYVMTMWRIGPVRRGQVRDQVYDWEKTRAFDPSFCRRHPKICKAAAACIFAAGTTLGILSVGGLTRNEYIISAQSCANAASAVLLQG